MEQNQAQNQEMTQAEFNKLNYTDRCKLKADNPELFHRLNEKAIAEAEKPTPKQPKKKLTDRERRRMMLMQANNIRV